MLAQVAVGRRDDPDVDAPRPTRSAPTFCSSPVSRNRSSRPCIRSVISPISSRKIVPSCASFELAGLVAIGAGEAPFDVAEQLRFEQRFRQARAVDGARKSSFARGPSEWTARATTSLPTPLSPVIRTLASDRATRSTSSRRSSIIGLVPTNSGSSPTLIRMRTLSREKATLGSTTAARRPARPHRRSERSIRIWCRESPCKGTTNLRSPPAGRRQGADEPG